MKDFGYFGSGDEGYAQYMTAFERNFGTEHDSDMLSPDDEFTDSDSNDDDL